MVVYFFSIETRYYLSSIPNYKIHFWNVDIVMPALHAYYSEN